MSLEHVFFVSIIRPIVLLSGESYWITSLWLSFISFLACWRATSTLTVLYPKIRSLFVICLLLTPSVVFWSSGLMKDAIIFAAFVTVVSLVVKIHKHSKITIVDILLLLLGGFLLLKLKHYLLITSMLFFGIILANRMLYQIKGKTRWIIAAISLIVIIGTTQYIHPYLRINRIAWTLYDINQTIHANEDETHLDIVIVDASWNSVLTQIPKALHAGLLRPSILDTTPSWGWIHKVENLLLTLCMMLSILILIKKKIRIDWPLLTASAICILLLATMLPLSTPNFGSLVRYKNAFFPFLLLLTSILPFHYFYSDSVE